MSQVELLEKFNQLPESLQKQVLSYVSTLVEQNAEEQAKLERSSKRRNGFGILKGRIKMAEDFDEPLEDFKDYMK
jgi:Protein of unknown function (DUF2281)